MEAVTGRDAWRGGGGGYYASASCLSNLSISLSLLIIRIAILITSLHHNRMSLSLPVQRVQIQMTAQLPQTPPPRSAKTFLGRRPPHPPSHASSCSPCTLAPGLYSCASGCCRLQTRCRRWADHQQQQQQQHQHHQHPRHHFVSRLKLIHVANLSHKPWPPETKRKFTAPKLVSAWYTPTFPSHFYQESVEFAAAHQFF